MYSSGGTVYDLPYTQRTVSPDTWFITCAVNDATISINTGTDWSEYTATVKLIYKK